jgi:hypothetical protein
MINEIAMALRLDAHGEVGRVFDCFGFVFLGLEVVKMERYAEGSNFE